MKLASKLVAARLQVSQLDSPIKWEFINPGHCGEDLISRCSAPKCPEVPHPSGSARGSKTTSWPSVSDASVHYIGGSFPDTSRLGLLDCQTAVGVVDWGSMDWQSYGSPMECLGFAVSMSIVFQRNWPSIHRTWPLPLPGGTHAISL